MWYWYVSLCLIGGAFANPVTPNKGRFKGCVRRGHNSYILSLVFFASTQAMEI